MVNTPPFSGLIKDDQAGSVEKNQDDNAMRNSNALHDMPKVSLKKVISPTENSPLNNSNALHKAHWKKGNCIKCGSDFEKRTTWQKYCTDLCRIQAYEERTGKTWHGKKTAATAGG